MNTAPSAAPGLWSGFGIRDSIVIGSCATLIVLSGLLSHLSLHLPGHRVLPLVFFLLLARASVCRASSATATGILSALLSFGVGVGAVGGSHIAKYVVAGLITDMVCLLVPSASRKNSMGVVVGAIAGLSWFPMNILINRLVGMEADVAFRLVLLKTASAAMFGGIGGALAAHAARPIRTSAWFRGTGSD